MRASEYHDLNSVLQCLVTTEDSEASLAAILKNSIVNSVEEIHAHFDSMPSKKGTKILIWNIRRFEPNTKLSNSTPEGLGQKKVSLA